MANATILPKTLRIGVDEPLYSATGGAINTTGAMGTFGLPPQSSVWRGALILQGKAIGGAGTALTVDLEVSLDGGTTFGKMTGATGLAIFTAAASTPVRVDVSGLGGNGQLRLNATTVTLNAASGFDVWAHIG